KKDLEAKGIRVRVDDTEKSPGWKFAEAEMRGIPVRVEIGPKDIEAKKAILARRDTGEKTECSMDALCETVGSLLEGMQKDMLERARARRDSQTYTATTKEEFEKLFAEKSGFVKAMWCGNVECENEIKEKLSVTSRCMPFEQETVSDVCVCCGKPAKKLVYWGRAY
ncbi:MAG: proline--tRNA ligase, partial [Lachnospiraceae bacterium]|nr:proline--tRNA ligase [Lachnospiraceae bacterium]